MRKIEVVLDDEFMKLLTEPQILNKQAPKVINNIWGQLVSDLESNPAPYRNKVRNIKEGIDIRERLTEEEILKIRKSKLTEHRLSKIYNVELSTIKNIKTYY